MKYKYINPIEKFNIGGKQLRVGDVITRKNLNGLPGNWFEAVDTKTKKIKEDN